MAEPPSLNGNGVAGIGRTRLAILSTASIAIAGSMGGIVGGVFSYIQDERGQAQRQEIIRELRADAAAARADMTAAAKAEFLRLDTRIVHLDETKADESIRLAMLRALDAEIARLNARLDRIENLLFRFPPDGPR